jgi:chemotaxis protein histidine kinase CheA
MATVRDITEQVLLEKKLKESEERTNRQMNWMLSILHVEPAMLQEFIEGVQKEFDFIENMLNSGNDNRLEKRLESVYRSIHLIKGNASLLALNFFADQAHQCEDLITGLQKKERILRNDLKPLSEKLTMMRQSLKEVHGLLDRISDIHNQMRPKRRYEQQMLIQSLNNLVKQLGKDHQKDIDLDTSAFKSEEMPQKHKLVLKDAIVQLIRNAAAHGIELPEVRKTAGKPAKGKITISSFKENKRFGIRLRDDGCGLQIQKIKEKVVASGKWPKEEIEQWSKGRIIDTIYSSGISTSDDVDMHAGRGVGLAGVKEKLSQRQGAIAVSFEEGAYTEFTILLPA